VRAVLTKSNPDMIFHLASTVTAQEKLDLVQPTLQNIVVASVNLMTAAAEVGCKKMVICGTAEQPADLNESPASPYAAAKEAVSTYAKLFRHKFAMDIREVKPFFTFGPGQNASKLVPHIVTSFMGRSAPMLSDADRSFDLIYVNDVVRGMIAVSLAPQPTRECIDLGTGIATTMKDLTNRIAEFTGTDVNAIFNNPDKRSSTAGRTANMSTAVQGWKPMWSLDDGLQETIAWYRRWGIHHG
jgi:nucleoside-diphosphate-sugar epimerase